MVNNDPGTRILAPTVGRRARKKRDVRERLYQTALRLFRAGGYDETSVQTIADAADVAKGTFFNYFPAKEDILAEYHDRMAADVLEAARSRPVRSAESAAQHVLGECAAFATDDPIMARLLLRVMFADAPLLRADRRNEEQLAAHLGTVVREGIVRRELRADLDVELFVSMLVGTLSATVTEWVVGEMAFDLETRLRRKIGFLFTAARRTVRRGPVRRGRR